MFLKALYVNNCKMLVKERFLTGNLVINLQRLSNNPKKNKTFPIDSWTQERLCSFV